MKVAVTISVEDAYPEALVVFRGLEQNLPTISEMGYDGIELAVWNENTVAVPIVKRLLSECHLELPVVSTGQVFTKEEAWFTHPEREVRRRSVEIMRGIVRFASEFGAAVNVSRVRGCIPDGVPAAEAFKWLDESMTELAEYAAPLGVDLVLEQMNMFETDMLNSVEEVGAYISHLGKENVKIHADTFHMNIHDVDMCDVLRRYSELLGYVHLADSNRLSPGKGHIDFPALLATLSRAGYDRWLGIEVLAKPDGPAAARDAIEYVTKILHGVQ